MKPKKKNLKQREERADAAIQRLYVLGDELRGVGFLIQNQKAEDAVSIDLESPYSGVGSILESLGRTVRKSVVAIEEYLIKLHSR